MKPFIATVAAGLAFTGIVLFNHHSEQQKDSWEWVVKHCTNSHPCYNGNVPTYDNPNCWPGAIYCPFDKDSIVKVTTDSTDGYNYICDHFENGNIRCKERTN